MRPLHVNRYAVQIVVGASAMRCVQVVGGVKHEGGTWTSRVAAVCTSFSLVGIFGRALCFCFF